MIRTRKIIIAVLFAALIHVISVTLESSGGNFAVAASPQEVAGGSTQWETSAAAEAQNPDSPDAVQKGSEDSQLEQNTGSAAQNLNPNGAVSNINLAAGKAQRACRWQCGIVNGRYFCRWQCSWGR